MDFQRAFVISLTESEDRRNRFFRRAQRAGLDIEWFPAIRGSQVNLDDLRRDGYLADDFKLRTPGSLGTLLSHVKVWEQVEKDSDCDVALVFEDDALLDPGFKSRLHALPIESIPADWDMLWLGWHKLDCEPVNELWGKPHPKQKIGTNSGHFAYLIKSSSIPLLRSFLIPYNNRNSKDNLLRKNFANFGAYFLLKRMARTPLLEFDSVRKNLNDPKRNDSLRRRIGQWISKLSYWR